MAGRNHSIQYSIDSPQALVLNDDELAVDGAMSETRADNRTMCDMHPVLDAMLGFHLMMFLVITSHSSAGHE